MVAGQPVGKGLCKWALVGGDVGVGERDHPATGEPRWTWLAPAGWCCRDAAG